MVDYPGQDSFHATITVLPDNAKPSALNFAQAVEGLADRTTFLANRGSRGAYVQASTSNTPATGTIYGATGGSGQFTEFAATGGLTPYLDVPDLEVGDVLLVWVSGSFVQGGNGTSNYAEIKLYATQDYGGSPPPAAAIQGAHARVNAATGDTPLPIMVQGLLVITTAGTCRVRLRGMNPDASGVSQDGYKVGLEDGGYPLTIGATVLRPTSTWGGA